MGFLDRKRKYFDRDKKYGLRRFSRSFINSVNGVCVSYKDEQSLFIHFVFCIVILVLGIVFSINRYDWVLSIILMGLILCAELLNTAIEAGVDLTTAKDVGSAATFMMSIIALVGELIIFVPHIIEFFS